MTRLVLLLSFFFLLLVPTSSWAALAHVQSKTNAACCSQSSVSVTLSSNMTSGNALAIAFYFDDTTATFNTIDTSSCQSLTLTGPVDTVSNSQGGPHGKALTFYAKNIASGSCTLTASTVQTITFHEIMVHELSGADTVSPLDQHKTGEQTNPGTGTDAITTASATTTANGEYIFAYFRASTGNTPSHGTGYTTGESGGSFMSEYQIQSSAGSIAGTFTQGTEGGDPVSVMMTFKAASAGANTSYFRRRIQ